MYTKHHFCKLPSQADRQYRLDQYHAQHHKKTMFWEKHGFFKEKGLK